MTEISAVPTTSSVSFVEAARLAVRQEMRRDVRVWVLGEDVARGGLFGQYADFLSEFGPERICSTPISEAAIMGAGLGAALVGTRPIIDMRIFDFTMCAMDELVGQIAKIRYMFGGQAKPSLVVRMPHGIWRNSAAQHSQMLESWFAHLPGVVVVAPSSPADQAGLLVSAIRCDDPVLIFEPKLLFSDTGDLDQPVEPIPFGKANQISEGDDLTIVSWSSMVPRCRSATATLRSNGIEAELFDLRTIWPWDSDAICKSVARTKRLLVVHEAVGVAGFGAEVIAHVVEKLGPRRIETVKRLAAPRVPVPFSPVLEAAITVSADQIVKTATKIVGERAS